MFNRLCSFKDFKSSDILNFINDTSDLKKSVLRHGWHSQEFNSPKLVTQVFFESSTRTRVSFELAAHRLNLKFSHFQMDDSTSLAKGESILDSLKVFEALKPDLIIFRANSDKSLNQFMAQTQIPYICAGLGHEFHPTQALLDLFTIKEVFNKDFTSLTLLFVGDTRASRVVGSHLELAKLLGYKIIQCSDVNHSRSDITNIQDLSEAVTKAEVIIRLRTQKERGSELNDAAFKLNAEHLNDPKKFLMHPGPFLRGEDFTNDLPEHPQSLIWQQKENGLYIRAMLYKKIWSVT